MGCVYVPVRRWHHHRYPICAQLPYKANEYVYMSTSLSHLAEAKSVINKLLNYNIIWNLIYMCDGVCESEKTRTQNTSSICMLCIALQSDARAHRAHTHPHFNGILLNLTTYFKKVMCVPFSLFIWFLFFCIYMQPLPYMHIKSIFLSLVSNSLGSFIIIIATFSVLARAKWWFLCICDWHTKRELWYMHNVCSTHRGEGKSIATTKFSRAHTHILYTIDT